MSVCFEAFLVVDFPTKDHPKKKTFEPRKNPSYFPLYWLVNRDPYNGLLQSLYNWVGFHPLYQTTNQGFFHCSFGGWGGIPLSSLVAII